MLDADTYRTDLELRLISPSLMGWRGPRPVLAFIGAKRTAGALDQHQKPAVDRERMKPAADQRDIDARNQLAPEQILGKKSGFKQVYSITI
jgi:hypothetical protein